MKLSSSVARAISLFPAAALARSISVRDDVTTITDQYLFDISLDQFITYRDALDPNTVDWTSDGCTDSPDNPLGFDFEPACYRHDFGYTNYRAQSRFTESAKASIDSNFLSDLKYQCQSEWFESLCDALAEVYYAAVKAFGGQDATAGKRTPAQDDLVAEYEAKLAAYNQLLAEAQANGDLSSAKEKRDAVTDWVATYQQKLDAYNKLVAEAEAHGEFANMTSHRA